MAKIHLGWPQISQIPIEWHLGHRENLKSSQFDALEAEKIAPGPAHESVLTGRERCIQLKVPCAALNHSGTECYWLKRVAHFQVPQDWILRTS